MTHADPWLDALCWAFLIANAGRILAYLPQILSIWRSRAGARSVSILTWSYFAFAHLTGVLYACFVLGDKRSIWMFSGNLVVTVTLVLLLIWKRRQHRGAEFSDATLTVAKQPAG